MDLLAHYGSSDEDDEEKGNETAENAVAAAVSTHEKVTNIKRGDNNNDDRLAGAGERHQQPEPKKHHVGDCKEERKKKQKRGHVTLVTDTTTAAAAAETTTRKLFTRSQPHVPGNWAGHVFINLGSTGTSNNAVITQQAAAATAAVQQWKDYLETRMGWTGIMVTHYDSNNKSNWHVSLSRTFYLQKASLDSFVQRLQQRLQCVAPGWIRILGSGSSTQAGDDVSLHHHDNILINDERTRSFLTWPVVSQTSAATTSSAAAAGILETLVQHVNAVLACYGQPAYYDPPQFHVSLASIPAVVHDDDNNGNNGGSFQDDEHKPVVRVSDENVPKSAPASSSSSSLFLVREVVCTFGTTKHVRIPLWDGSGGMTGGSGDDDDSTKGDSSSSDSSSAANGSAE